MEIALGMVQHPAFDYVTGFLVIANCIETDHNATHLLSASTSTFRNMNTFFCIVFALELAVRVVAYGCRFFYAESWRWNMFDFILVVIQILDELSSRIANESAADHELSDMGNFTFLRVLRIMRLIRIVRLIRILRLIQELRTIVISILGSLRSLFWTVLLLFVLVYIFAVFVTQQVIDYRLSQKAAGEMEHDERLIYLFGSLSRAILSMYQAISGGLDWDNVAEPLMSKISVALGLVMACYVALAILALMNVVTGVFVESALQSAKDDRQSSLLQHVKKTILRGGP